jgi:tetratricopeptide (TPR) repeat protein
MARSEEVPYGEARTVLVEDALREAAGDDELVFQVRMQLTRAYQYGGEPIKTFTTFSRCLTEFDRDPGRFPGVEHRLLWQYKWIINSLTKFPEVPLERAHATLDDMERRYRQGGHSMHAIYALRASIAQHLGDAEAADRWYTLWHAAPRDELSNCVACDPSGKASYLAWRERDEDALAIAEPVLSNEINCAEQPQDILTDLLPIYLRTGRLRQAAEAHRKAYRIQRSQLSDLGGIGAHLEFLARSGNEARGLEILERHLGWLDRAPSPSAALRFAAAGALVLRRLAETGHGELMVRRPLATDLPVEELRKQLTERALEIAARFDARNGTSERTRITRLTLEAQPIVDHLPLTAHSARPPRVEPVPAAPVVLPADPDALLDVAEEHWSRYDITNALAAWHRFDEVCPDPSTAQLGRRADGLGLARTTEGDLAGAQREWERAVDLHEQAGEPERRLSTLSRVGMCLCYQGETDQGLALLHASVEGLATAESSRLLTAQIRLAKTLGQLGSPEEALAALDQATPEAPADLAEVSFIRAQSLAATGRITEAVAAARKAVTSDLPDGDLRAEAALLLGRLLAADESTVDEAGDPFTMAVSQARAPGLRETAYQYRGGWLLQQGRSAEAIDDLVEAVAGFSALGAVQESAGIRRDLCVAYYREGRHLEAAEVAEEVIVMFEDMGDEDAAQGGRWMLANAQRGLGELEAAAAGFTALAEVETDPHRAADLFEQAGELLAQKDKDGTAADRFLAARTAYQAAEDPFSAVRTGRRAAYSLYWGQRTDESLAVFAETRTAAAALPADSAAAVTWEQAVLDYDEARVLSSLHRTDEARALADAAITGFTSLDEQSAAEVVEEFRSRLA